MKTKKYHYSPIKSVITSSNKYSNIFGVVSKYQEQGVYLRDESYDSIKVNFSNTFVAILPHIKPGNIIRIHRLMNAGNQQYRCIKVSDLLLFTGFKDKDAAEYKVRFDAKQPTCEMSDFARVAELERWVASMLLEFPLKNIESPGWYDLVCQVVDIKDISSDRVILTVYDGTSPRLKFYWPVLTSVSSKDWGDYPLEKLVKITVWDRRTVKARKLEKGSFITIFNLQVAPAKRQSGTFELHLRGGNHYGKMIRVVHPNSYLGVDFKSRLDQSVNNNQPEKPLTTTVIDRIHTTTSTSINKPTSSTHLHIDRDLSSDIGNLSDIGSSISEESEESPKNKNKQSNPSEPAVPVKKIKLNYEVRLPFIIDIDKPEHSIGIKDYLDKNTTELTSIKARVIDYKPASKDIINFIKLVCPNCDYKESPSGEIIKILKRSKGPRTSFLCPDCQDKSEIHHLNAAFWIHLSLRDAEGYEITISLEKLDLFKMIGVTVVPVLNSTQEANKIFDFLDYICPTNDIEASNTPSNLESRPYLNWVIQRRPGGPIAKWKYRVVTVFREEDEE